MPMPQTPLVSFVIPVYNQADYLEAAIESVLSQDYKRLECIVIDDGSNDDSLAVAQRCAARHPERLRVLSQSNAGQSMALNRGWAMSGGSLLAYLSSDDCLCPGAISHMVTALEADPQAMVSYCDYWLIDSNGQRLRLHQSADFSAVAMRVDLVQPPGPGAIFRREVFVRLGGWNSALQQVPDFQFWLRAADLGRFVRVPICLAEYRIHETSSSFRAMSNVRANEIVDVMRAYWQTRTDQEGAVRSISNALSLAAKNHAQSGRVPAALGSFARAVRLRPGLVLESSIWRRLLVGFTRRAYYGARASIGRSS